VIQTTVQPTIGEHLVRVTIATALLVGTPVLVGMLTAWLSGEIHAQRPHTLRRPHAQGAIGELLTGRKSRRDA
jgi:hypothetical protein